MPRYHVQVQETIFYAVTVDAETEAEAEQFAVENSEEWVEVDSSSAEVVSIDALSQEQEN